MAGPFDFTGQNIEDTYQRLVQVSGSGFCDGTGSAVSIGGSQNLQQVTEQGAVTTIPITASIISASGDIEARNLSGVNTGDQDLSPYLLSSKTGSFATTGSGVLFTHITASTVSASNTGSFAHVKATNIEGNSPLNIKGVSSITFGTDPGQITFVNTDLYGNPIFHGDVNVYSSSAFLGTNDEFIFRSNDETDTLEIGGTQYKTRIEGTGIELVQAVTASTISASGALTASNLSGNNTGDQDLSSYIQNSQTSSFVQNSQTSSFAIIGSNVLFTNVTASIISASFITASIHGGTF